MHTDRGFTLLEVLVALACTAIVLLAAARAVTRAADARAHATARAADVDAARSALTALATELPAALPGTLRLERRPGGHPALRFVVSDPAPARITWTLDGDRVARSAPSAFAADAASAPATTQVERVARFDVRALGREGWTTTWDDARLPRAVEIVLEPSGEPSLTVRVALPMRGRS